MQLIFYHAPGQRSRRLAEAFVAGCKGRLAADPRVLEPHGPWGFYGVKPATAPAFAAAQRAHKLDCVRDPLRSYIYVDNAYFGGSKWYRVTWDAEQLAPGVAGCPPRPGRVAACGGALAEWKAPAARGPAVLVAVQSPFWYERHGTTLAAWTGDILAAVRAATDRPVLLRVKPRFAAETRSILAAVGLGAAVRSDQPESVATDLAHAWCVVTHTSAVAIEAVLAGIPAFVTHPCAVMSVSSGARAYRAESPTAHLAGIESPEMPDRDAWAERLAANQWCLSEIERGTCWNDLTANGRGWAE